MAETPAVAIIGAGRMGAAMAGTLRRAGVGVTIYNRTRARAEEVAGRTGARVAATAREAAASAPVVLSSLADDRAVLAACEGPDGTVAGLGAGSVLLETSTVDPETVRRLEPAVTARGAALLDAPVSGSVPVVDKGELMFMVGGDAGALEHARGALEPLARRVIHVGPLGAGATVKLAVNALLHQLNTALSEALVLAERAGVERDAAYEAFAESAASSPFVQYKRAAFEHPEEAPVAFSVELMGKDLDLILGLAGRVGAPMPQAEVTRRVVAEAAAAGLAGEDMSAVARYLRALGTPPP